MKLFKYKFNINQKLPGWLLINLFHHFGCIGNILNVLIKKVYSSNSYKKIT